MYKSLHGLAGISTSPFHHSSKPTHSAGHTKRRQDDGARRWNDGIDDGTARPVIRPGGLLDNSWIRQLADWSTRGLDNLRTYQLKDWTTHGYRPCGHTESFA